jgi:hypothetical protein
MVAARKELDNVIDGIWNDIDKGVLKPYANKTVYLP